jgi:hypothetical protein
MTTAAILHRWAALGRSARVQSPAVDWTPASRMIDAAEKDAKESRKVLKGLLESSAGQPFPGFRDPLDLGLDFGTHRCLTGSREESWSNWLAWILERRGDSSHVLSLFGLDPALVARTTCAVEREFCTRYGRLDMVVRFGDATLLVEIKTISEVREGQLEDYTAWLKTQSAPLAPVLLAVDEPENLPTDCQFCSWESVSMGLRTWASTWLREKRKIEAALTLAFCGAVEQNLLGFGRGLNAPRTAEYLKTWLERNKDEKKNPDSALLREDYKSYHKAVWVCLL